MIIVTNSKPGNILESYPGIRKVLAMCVPIGIISYVRNYLECDNKYRAEKAANCLFLAITPGN